MILSYKLKNKLMTDSTLNLENLLNTNNDYKSAFIEICNNKNLLESTLKDIGIKNVLSSNIAFDILLNSEIGRQNIFNNIEFLSYLNLNYNSDAKKHTAIDKRLITFIETIIKDIPTDFKQFYNYILVSIQSNVVNHQSFSVPNMYYKINTSIPNDVKLVNTVNLYCYYPISTEFVVKLMNTDSGNRTHTLRILTV